MQPLISQACSCRQPCSFSARATQSAAMSAAAMDAACPSQIGQQHSCQQRPPPPQRSSHMRRRRHSSAERSSRPGLGDQDMRGSHSRDGAAHGGGRRRLFRVQCNRPDCDSVVHVSPEQLGLEPVSLEPVNLEAVNLEPVNLERVELVAVNGPVGVENIVDRSQQSETPAPQTYTQVRIETHAYDAVSANDLKRWNLDCVIGPYGDCFMLKNVCLCPQHWDLMFTKSRVEHKFCCWYSHQLGYLDAAHAALLLFVNSATLAQLLSSKGDHISSLCILGALLQPCKSPNNNNESIIISRECHEVLSSPHTTV